MGRAERTKSKNTFLILFAFCIIARLPSLDFSIMNRGEIIFQEILIETDQTEETYFFNFGMTGLEPGARHNIHISTTEDIIFCSFYLFGISNENYVIENVAIEQNTVVYILPEHYQEDMDVYHDVDNPDAVYGALLFDRSEYSFLDEESPENQYRTELELFNYTNSPIFRIYFFETPEEEEEAVSTEAPLLENLLDGDVLKPQESVTIRIAFLPETEYLLQLKGADNLRYEKKLSPSDNTDFLVFYDSDKVTEWENLPLQFINNSPEELKEIYLIDQEWGTRVEVLAGTIMVPGSTIDYLLMKEILLCDIIARTASNEKIYMFDWHLKDEPIIVIEEE